jgi:hypothetical protein
MAWAAASASGKEEIPVNELNRPRRVAESGSARSEARKRKKWPGVGASRRKGSFRKRESKEIQRNPNSFFGVSFAGLGSILLGLAKLGVGLGLEQPRLA